MCTLAARSKRWLSPPIILGAFRPFHVQRMHDGYHWLHIQNSCWKVFGFAWRVRTHLFLFLPFASICGSLRRQWYSKILFILASYVNWHCARYTLQSLHIVEAKMKGPHCRSIIECRVNWRSDKADSDALKQEACNQYSKFYLPSFLVLVGLVACYFFAIPIRVRIAAMKMITGSQPFSWTRKLKNTKNDYE